MRPKFMLYVIGTPIGNLEDMSFRAVSILKEADVVLCEDTRVTKVLLSHFEITTRMLSCHQHSGVMKHEKVMALLRDGNSLALVSDAGTPGISDPGGKLLSYLYEHGYTEIVSIPGPSALAAGLSISGFFGDEFVFLGFIPTKKGRKTLLTEIGETKRTVVFYESKYRIQKTLNELAQIIGARRVFVAREITKKFETSYRGGIKEILPHLLEKGEFVVIVEGK